MSYVKNDTVTDDFRRLEEEIFLVSDLEYHIEQLHLAMKEVAIQSKKINTIASELARYQKESLREWNL